MAKGPAVVASLWYIPSDEIPNAPQTEPFKRTVKRIVECGGFYEWLADVCLKVDMLSRDVLQ